MNTGNVKTKAVAIMTTGKPKLARKLPLGPKLVTSIVR